MGKSKKRILVLSLGFMEYQIRALEPYTENIIKPEKTYLNLGKKDRWQR